MSTETVIKQSTKEKKKVKRPPMYKVIFHNDNFTPMGFVIIVLIRLFNKSTEEAEKIMLEVHNQGKAVVGVYNKEIAATKQHLTEQNAKMHQHPLKCTIEPVEDDENK